MLQFSRFVAMRLVMAVITLLTVSFIVFSLMELVPANCAERYLAFKNSQGQQISVSDIRAEEIRMGLDKPYVIRWVNWVTDVFVRGAPILPNRSSRWHYCDGNCARPFHKTFDLKHVTSQMFV